MCLNYSNKYLLLIVGGRERPPGLLFQPTRADIQIRNVGYKYQAHTPLDRVGSDLV